jgi:hypothetical protein
MALIKTRPDVRLMLPRPLIAGEIGEFLVELDCPKEVPVDAVSLSLYGDMVWFTTSQYGRHRHTSRFLDHRVALLSDETELEAGKHQLRTRVRLDDQLPGSWAGDRLAVEYGVEVHVDIPWWPDKRVLFVVRVADAGRPQPDEQAQVVWASKTGGPPPKGPYLELSLGQRSVRPADTMRLSAALGNVERNRYRKLVVELLAQESFPTGLGGAYTAEHATARWSVAIDAHADELQPIPFSLPLPRSIVPAFALHGCELRWILQVTADVAWGVDPKLRLPLQVQPAAPIGLAPDQAAPLAVGSDRLRLIWSKVARDNALELDGDHLRGVVGDVTLDVHRADHDGRARVLGLLEFPPLGVGLRLHRTRRSMLGGLEAGVAARDAEQTAVLVERLGDVFAERELTEADDGRLVIALDGPGLELAPLHAFVSALVDLAGRVDALPDQLPAAAAMRPSLDAWTRAAAALGGRLRATDMCIELQREPMKVQLRCDWDDGEEVGRVRGTILELDPGLTIPSRMQLIWTGDTKLPDHELPLEPLVGGADRSGGRVALHIEPRRVRVLVPEALEDPLVERPRVDALIELGRVLHGDQGPYR